MTVYTGTPSTLVAGDTSALVTKFNDHRDALKAISEAWTSYVPTLVNLTIGNGTMVAAYSRVGKLIHFRVRIVFGNTTNISAAVTVGLPAAVGSVAQIGQCFIGSSSGTVPLTGTAFLSNGASVTQPFHPTSTSNGTQIQLGSAALTMNSGAYVMLQGTYEAA